MVVALTLLGTRQEIHADGDELKRRDPRLYRVCCEMRPGSTKTLPGKSGGLRIRRMS